MRDQEKGLWLTLTIRVGTARGRRRKVPTVLGKNRIAYVLVVWSG
jgi:hypothetical protein